MPKEDAEKWNARYARDSSRTVEAPRWLDDLGEEFPDSGRGLDLASGLGPVALFAAARGLDVSAVDISDIGLKQIQRRAAQAGLRVQTQVIDLALEPLPEGPFAWISCFHYRQPSLWPMAREKLSLGGVLVAEAMTVKNLERHAHPSRRWLMESQELLRAAEGLQVVYFREGWLSGRHVARLVARRPALPDPAV